MGILDSIVEWIATQIMNLLDLVTGSVLGALGCDMSTFLRYFPAAETLYEVFVAIAVGFILLNLVWQLFKNFGLGVGLSAEDPTKLAIKSILFIFWHCLPIRLWCSSWESPAHHMTGLSIQHYLPLSFPTSVACLR